MFDKFTGRKRHNIQTIRTGWFSTESILVLQYEVTGIKTSYAGGSIDSYTDTWWVNVRPEQLLTLFEDVKT